MKARNQWNLPSKQWLIIMIVVCLGLLGLSFASDGNDGPVNIVAGYTVVPMQKGINKIGMWFSDMTKNFATLEEVKKENEKLQAQVDNLTIENNQLIQDKYELARLEQLYKLDQDYGDYEKVGAHVISNNGTNWFSTFTVDKGANDGIEVDMNVMAGSGLVGIVTEVGPNWANIRSIIDDSSNVSGMVLTTGDNCIVEGDLTLIDDGKVKFNDLANNDNEVAIGEQIVTSYISNKYLSGILVGYVSDVNVDSNNLTRSGHITPAVDFSQLHEVLIITTTKEEMVNK